MSLLEFSFFFNHYYCYYRVSLEWRHLFWRGWWRHESRCLGLYGGVVLCGGSCEEFVSLCCVPPPSATPFYTQWVGEESLARCGRLYQFQIVYRIILSDSTRRRGPKMNLRRQKGVAALSWVQASHWSSSGLASPSAQINSAICGTVDGW